MSLTNILTVMHLRDGETAGDAVPPRRFGDVDVAYGDVVFDRCGHGEDWHGPDGCEARGCPCEVPR